jgi:hypothetical protein
MQFNCSVFSCGMLTGGQRKQERVTRKSEPSQSRVEEKTVASRSPARNVASLRQSLTVSCCNGL